MIESLGCILLFISALWTLLISMLILHVGSYLGHYMYYTFSFSSFIDTQSTIDQFKILDMCLPDMDVSSSLFEEIWYLVYIHI